MNCKPGDLAVIVKSYAGNEGKIVRCLEPRPNHKFLDLRDGTFFIAFGWLLDTEIKGRYGRTATVAADFQLRPLRNSDGADETLTWKAIPSPKVTA